MASCWLHYQVLLQRQWISRRRNWLQTSFEICMPLLFVVLLVGIWAAYSPIKYETRAFSTLPTDATADTYRILPVGFLPYKLRAANTHIAIAPRTAAELSIVESFVAEVGLLYPALNFATLGGGVLQNPILRNISVPSFADVLVKYPTPAAIETRIRESGYAEDGTPTIFAAIIFNSGPPNYDYSLRFNHSDVPSTLTVVDNLQRGFESVFTQQYVQVDASAVLRGAPGFMSLQLLVDRWILGRSAAPGSASSGVLFSTFLLAARKALKSEDYSTLAAEVDTLRTADPSGYAAMESDVGSWLRSETFMPQQVDLVPFPISEYTTNGFYTTVAPFLALILTLAYLYPVARQVSGVVTEKEVKMREALRMSGVGDAAIVSSWCTVFALQYSIACVLIIIVSGTTIFSNSKTGLILLAFLLFSFSAVSVRVAFDVLSNFASHLDMYDSMQYASLVSVLFTRGKTAASLGVVLFLAAFFPHFAVSAATSTAFAKIGASLLSPTAFGLLLDITAAFEDSGQGVTSDNYQNMYLNYSFAIGLGMLALDVVLYGILAWYIENVLPTRFRDFGVARPWYFCVTRSYWRDVCNVPTPASGSPQVQGPQVDAGGRPRRCCGLGWPSVSVPTSVDDKSSLDQDASFFENPDASMIQKERAQRVAHIRGLRKQFQTPDGPKIAVDGVDLTLYEGQICVLLGHNGAGKTTTISMVTGMLPPTAGSISVFGRRLESDLSEIRHDLGVCPQFDVLWPEVTVEEHLRIFAVIKGVPPDRIDFEVSKTIAEVGLQEKARVQASQLSGGQKRKLSICIALVGGSRFVLLDEPTSGMDPYSRRSTWQILQNARAGRILLLTTHFMDEADILGDRIAIMSAGRVVCYGSPLFLKHKFGVGYVLTLIRQLGAAGDPHAILDLLRRHAPDATVASNVGAELSIRLPLGSATNFPAMFQELDSHLSALGFVNYGLSITSMEDVFLKVAHGLPTSTHDTAESVGRKRASTAAADAVEQPNGQPVLGHSAAVPSTLGPNGVEAVRAGARKEVGGWRMAWQHLKALLIKRYHTTRRDKKAFCFQMLLPVIMIAIGLAVMRAGKVVDLPSLQLTTAGFNAEPRRMFSPSGPNRVPYFTFKSDVTTPDDGGIVSFMQSFPPSNISSESSALQITRAEADAISDQFGFIQAGTFPQRDWQRMSTFLLQQRGFYTESLYGAAIFTRSGTSCEAQEPTGLGVTDNIVTYSLLFNTTARHGAPTFVNLVNSHLLGMSAGGGSITTRSHPLPFTTLEAGLNSSLFTISAAVIILLALAFVPASWAIAVTKEREVNAKHQQLISGVSIFAYHLSAWLWDVSLYLIPGLLCVALCGIFGVKEFVSEERGRLGATFALFIGYGFMGAGFAYLVSFLFRTATAAQNGVLMIGLLALVAMIGTIFLGHSLSTCLVQRYIQFFFGLLPGFNIGYGLFQLGYLEFLPFDYRSCNAFHGMSVSDDLAFSATDIRVAGLQIAYLYVGGIVYLMLTIMVDVVKQSPAIRRRMLRKSATLSDSDGAEDEDVAREGVRVEQELQSGRVTDIVLVSKLQKMYPGGKLAVKNMSFGLPVGEVFGLLGVNGAGKTSTMSILAGDQLPSSGVARMAGFDIITEQAHVRRLLGYVPQFDALLDLMTVREHLELYARIKGVEEAELSRVVKAKLGELDLLQFANKTAGSLSGGNKRKLSVGIALIGQPRIVFLDEPSTGMDPVARRFMWSLISKVATEDRLSTIILTSHSMEEVEALCSRVGIAVAGRLRCLGTIQHLKNRFGQGYRLEIKLLHPPGERVQSVAVQMCRALEIREDFAGRVTRGHIHQLAEALDSKERVKQIANAGTGWAIEAALQNEATGAHLDPNTQEVPIAMLADWWAIEDVADAVVSYVSDNAFPGAKLVERQGSTLRFQVPPSTESLGDMFSKIEGAKDRLGIVSYAIGQTSLEDIFNNFAALAAGDQGVGRGLLVASHDSATELETGQLLTSPPSQLTQVLPSIH